MTDDEKGLGTPRSYAGLSRQVFIGVLVSIVVAALAATYNFFTGGALVEILGGVSKRELSNQLIRGRVMTAAGTPIKNAKVALEFHDAPQDAPQVMYTDTEGYFRFSVKDAGNKTPRIRIHVPPYAPYDRIVSLANNAIEEIVLERSRTRIEGMLENDSTKRRIEDPLQHPSRGEVNPKENDIQCHPFMLEPYPERCVEQQKLKQKPRATITYPGDQEEIPRIVNIKGTHRNIPENAELRLYRQSVSTGLFYVDPIFKYNDGSWETKEITVGAVDSHKRHFLAAVILVDQSGDEALRQRQDELESLPTHRKISIEIIITRK